MKIVIDTNVLMSAIFFGGKPESVIRSVIDGKFAAYASQAIIDEYSDTAEYLDTKTKKVRRTDLSSFFQHIHIIDTSSRIEVCRDPDDNKFLECAIDCDCLYIVSGDKDLLTIGKYEGVRIVTVSEFLSETD